MRSLFAFVLMLCFAANTTLMAQIKTPAPSPGSKIIQTVGLTEITLDYSRPSAKGRKIFGDLVPFGDLWRTGANSATKITFSENVKIAGNDVPKGTYALYSIPGTKEWTIILNKNTASNTGNYKQEEDVCRFTAPAYTMAVPIETFTMNFDHLTSNSCNIYIAWDKTMVSFPVKLGTDDKVMADIKAAMEGPSADTYYAAGVYYFNEGKDAKTALDWVNKSIEKGNEKFWVLRQKSLIQAKLGDYKGAMQTAARSKELAEQAKNNDYIRMNDASIMEWAKK